MKISLNWLKEFIEINEPVDRIAELLTQTGLEVEGIHTWESVKGGLEGLVVGRVLSCRPHPQAEKLSLTTVDLGNGEPVQIVCGAPNVATGQLVPVAPVNSVLYPDGNKPFKIKKAKLRGEVSLGMICAEDELGLGNNHDGIMVLSPEAKPGTPLNQYFDLATDTVIEIGLTPNRGDGASHLGVARDLKAVLQQPVTLPKLNDFVTPDAPCIHIEIENTLACPRYAGLLVKGVTVQASPNWLQNRLKSIGLQPINNIVDVTNYVLHHLGQPLHAFDLNQIKGNKIVVKNSTEGNKFITLDKVERTLTGQELMICNAEEPMVIAGVFGGLHSGVKPQTTNIFLESAYFAPSAVRKSSTLHSLKTDAAFRYERGTDPEMVITALKLAATLITQVAGGQVASAINDVYPNKVDHAKINLKLCYLNTLIGQQLPLNNVTTILNSLDIVTKYSPETETLHCEVPAYRSDVTRPADVVEEVLRIYGFDNIELSKHIGAGYLAEFPKPDPEEVYNKIAEALVGNGFYELFTNPISHSKYLNQTNGGAPKPAQLLNRHADALNVMRTHMVFSVLEAVAYNTNRQQSNLRFFELGKVYLAPSPMQYTETEQLTIALTGQWAQAGWQQLQRPFSLFDLKHFVQLVSARMGVHITFEPCEANTYFDAGLQAQANGKTLWHLAPVNHATATLVGVKQPVFLATANWQELLATMPTSLTSTEVPRYPEVQRDLSMIIDQKISFKKLEAVAFNALPQLLKRVNLFDVFEDERLGHNKKSYALSFTLQDENKTLTEKIIDKALKKLMNAYETEVNAEIRK